jgi:GTP diphosphokinase / guanosine-3',5'-bis(diphosphate) 3'-diphosphatase
MLKWTPAQQLDTKTPDELFRELVALVELYDRDKKHLDKLEKAYLFAAEAHKNQNRASGDPYIIHPLESAKILARIKMDIPTITAAILHDIIEDTGYTYEELKEKFGKTTADLVDGVTKLTAITENRDNPSTAKLDTQAENLRKIFLAMARDIRVILIKVADRLHNLKTLGALSEHKQKYIARESLEIFAPITGRLGMWDFKWQLEDTAFYYLEPDIYRKLAGQVAQKRKEREEMVEQVKEKIKSQIDDAGLKDVFIEGRPKHLFGIYQKMQEKNLKIDEVYDLLAVRVIVDSVAECYQILGIVHNLWMPLQGRFKDYIAMPKSNNYRSLHTTIYGPGNQPVEIQIRTWDMHKVNEFGIAAHWAYKEGLTNLDANMFGEVYPWIRRILDWQDESKDARDYIENLKLDLLESEVFVFTPNGDVIDLTKGSTPIDFAYRIHTEVGHRCIGAKVNSKIVPLEYQLKNADIVEILTSKHGTPSRDWLKIARTNHAKNKIRQWFKKERRDENIARGREMVIVEMKRNRIDIGINNDEYFGKIAERYNFLSSEDLFASIGYGESSATTVINRLMEMLPEDQVSKPVQELPQGEDEETVKRKEKNRRKAKSPILIKGVGNLMVKYGKCCSPVYGDDVIGYITLGKGVSIHRKDCPNYPSLVQNPERIAQVQWVEHSLPSLYNVELQLEGWDRAGLLSEVMGITNELDFFVKAAKAWAKNSRATIKISLEVPSKEALDNLIKKLKSISDIHKVYRVTHKQKTGVEDNAESRPKTGMKGKTKKRK